MDLGHYEVRSKVSTVLRGGGASGARLRALDWSKTSMGPLDRWPQSLRAVLSLVLDSSLPLCVVWGSDFIQFYNDAYESIQGLKTHAALGRSAAESPQIWNRLGPLFQDVLSRGESTCQEDAPFLLDRGGCLEEAYFTCSLSPIRDELGQVGGALIQVVETTERVLNTRRLQTLRDLALAASTVTGAMSAFDRVRHALAANTADIPFALLYLLDGAGTGARLVGAVGLYAGTALSPLDVDLKGSPDTRGWPIARVASSGHSELVNDVIGRVGPIPGQPWPGALDAALVMPVFRPGGSPRPGAVLICGLNPRRVFDDHYRTFLDLVSAHVGTVLVTASASDSERGQVATPDAQGGEDSEARFRILADNIAQLAWMADTTGWIFWYNRRWFDYTGTTLEDMQGWGWQQVHHPDHVARVVQKIRRCFETQEIWEDTFPLRARDGRYRWFLSRAIPIRNAAGEVVRWLGTNTDITAERDAEEALREAHRRKDEFLAVLGHELRNPLAPILGATEVLALRSAEDAKAQRACDIIARQAKQLAKLIDDLLDVGRIITGKLRLRKETVELHAVLSQAAETCRPEIERRRHALHVELPAEPIYFEADGGRLVQVLCNLLNNAAKYMRDGGRIWMRTHYEPGKITISVRDEGIGIAADMLTQVFEPFVQLRSSLRRAEGGFGVGLPLVRSIVEMHGGTVEARSDGLGAGSEFRVHLPALRNAPVAMVQNDPSVSRVKLTKRRVLIVDDNRDSAEVLAALLHEWNQDVRVAYDGLTAIDLAQAYRPDLVLLELGLAGITGPELARQLRREPELQQTAIIAVTGFAPAAAVELDPEAHFDAHLVKPWNSATLQDLILRFAAHPGQVESP